MNVESLRETLSIAMTSRPLALLILASCLLNGEGLRQGSPPGPFLAAKGPFANAGDFWKPQDAAPAGGWHEIRSHFKDISFGKSINNAIDYIGAPGIMLAVFVSISGVIALYFLVIALEREKLSSQKEEKEMRSAWSGKDKCLGASVMLCICVVCLFFLLGWFFGGNLLKDCIERFDVAFLGTHVRLESLDVSPFEGTVSATGLTLYNPPGWTSKYLLHIDSIFVDLNMLSFIFSLGQAVDISRVLVKGVNVIYQKSLQSSNLQDFLDHLQELYGGDKQGTDMAVHLHEMEILNVTARLEFPGVVDMKLAVPDIVDRNFAKTLHSTEATSKFIVDFLLKAVLKNVMDSGH